MFITPASLLFRLRKSGEPTAWDRFVELYTPLLFHWAQQLEVQDSDRADLVQDVFLILWRKLPEFEYDPGKSFHAWLKTIFLNRHRSRQRQHVPAAIGIYEVEPIAEQLTQTEAEDVQYLIRQAFRLIEGEFSQLHQQIFRLYVLEEREPEEVAQRLGIRPGTVYGVKSKILSRLRQELSHLLD